MRRIKNKEIKSKLFSNFKFYRSAPGSKKIGPNNGFGYYNIIILFNIGSDC